MGTAPPKTPPITFDFDGRPIAAERGEPVGVALLRAGIWTLARSVKYHRPRGLFCLAGHCGNCLVRANGEPDRLACRIPAEEGLEISTQNALPSAERDLLRAIDWAFPHGMNPHEMLTGVPIAQDVMAAVARRLAGLGELPGAARELEPTVPEIRTPVALVGQGRAGRRVASALADRAVPFLAFEGDPFAEPGGAEGWPGSLALGLYLDGGRPLLAVRRGEQIVRVRPDRIVLCTGSRDQPPSFEGNDLPGVVGGRAARRLVERHGLLPARSALVVGEGPESGPAAKALAAAGAQVTRVGDGSSGRSIVRAIGGRRVRGAILEDAQPSGAPVDATPALEPGARPGQLRWKGELIVAAGPRASAFELGAQAGARVLAQGARGFPIEVDDRGRTNIPWLSAAGSCTTSALSLDEQAERIAASLGTNGAG